MKETMLIGAFDSHSAADKAIEELMDMGYTKDDISLIARGEDVYAMGRREPTTGERIGGDAVTGGVIGGVVGLIAGALGILVIGPLAALLGLTGLLGTTVTGVVLGAATGGIVGALASIGVPEETARKYEEVVRAGGIILAVPERENKPENIRRILEDNGAQGTSEIEVQSK